MKRYIHAAENKEINRIQIDFYNYDVEEEIAASKNLQNNVFKNVKVVMRDVKQYIESKGLRVLSIHQSTFSGSNSTYYDVDVKVLKPDHSFKYLFFRISDHPENPLAEDSRKAYNEKMTRKHEGLPESADVSNMFKYRQIVVNGKKYTNYSKALSKVRQEIDEELRKEGLLDE